MSYSHRGKPPITIGAKELNYCVRYGNRCDLFAIITRLYYFSRHIILYQISYNMQVFFVNKTLKTE